MTTTCACGRPLHYGDPLTDQRMAAMTRLLGEHIPMTTPDGTWLVQVYYLQLHGLHTAELPALAARLGFREVFRCPVCGRISNHPDDLTHGYCSACHAFTAAPKG